METIQAKVNQRLLSKADRFFTGSMAGRIIEVLQNARRAGATEVRIENKDSLVYVQDNGSGIDDFQELLDLGSSGWDEKLEAGEDPAGVGLFCLAPREVRITSGNRFVTIKEAGWTGKPVKVLANKDSVKGTILKFQDDEPWDFGTVEKHAVFCGMKVIVDGRHCHSRPFCSKEAVDYPDLGCRIGVVREISEYHKTWASIRYRNRVFVNYHGQVVALNYWPDNITCSIHVLVDLTEQTQIRLMLPARTKLVENDVLKKLREAIEIEIYRFIHKQGRHRLQFKEYLRGKGLGFDLPESEPVFDVGTLSGDSPEPVEVVMPDDLPLSKCYRFDSDIIESDKGCKDNVHLLAALCKFDKPFVPVTISKAYDGYSWTKMQTIKRVELSVGRKLNLSNSRFDQLVAVDSLQVTVHTSDGAVFKSNVPIAVGIPEKEEDSIWDTNVYLTIEAREQLTNVEIWYHFGGYYEEGDTYETQEEHFEDDLERFWVHLIGPDDYLRARLRDSLCGFNFDWKKITIDEDWTVTILHSDDTQEVFGNSSPEPE